MESPVTEGEPARLYQGLRDTKMHDEESYNFDLEQLLGEACLLNVGHVEKDGKTYANVSNASPLAKWMEALQINGQVLPREVRPPADVSVSEAALSKEDMIRCRKKSRSTE